MRWFASLAGKAEKYLVFKTFPHGLLLGTLSAQPTDCSEASTT